MLKIKCKSNIKSSQTPSVHQPLTDSQLALFAEQLSLLLHSGISLLEGISILHDDLPEGSEKLLLSQIMEHLEFTGELSISLSETGCWPNYFIKMTELGERSGTLEDVMHSLSVHYTKRNHLLKSMKEAIIYPFILLSMLSAVLFILMTRVMPVFYQVFRQLGIEISGMTAAVFQISRISQSIAVILLILVIVTILFLMILLRTERGKQQLLKILHPIPLIRHICHLSASSRFSNAMSIAVHCGLDMGESFELASLLTEDTYFQNQITAASSLLEQGTELSEALQQTKIFTGMHARMFSIGFRTGSADIVLEQISSSCQEEADHRIQTAVGLLEPVLTVILSILTGMILISVMLPLLSVMSTIG